MNSLKNLKTVFAIALAMVLCAGARNTFAMKKRSEIETPNLRGAQLVCSQKNPYMTPESVSCVKNLLLTNPGKLLEKNIDAQEWYEAFKNCGRLRLKKTFEILSTQNPLFFLTECLGKNCPMNRLKRPEVREAYTRVAKHVTQNGFFDVGSGGLFQTCQILANALEENPKASFSVFLVDPACEKIWSCSVNGKVDTSKLEGYEALFLQVFTFFKTAYPKANVDFFIYEDVYRLINDIREKKLSGVPLPKTIISSDLDMSTAVQDLFILFSFLSVNAPSEKTVLFQAQKKVFALGFEDEKTDVTLQLLECKNNKILGRTALLKHDDLELSKNMLEKKNSPIGSRLWEIGRSAYRTCIETCCGKKSKTDSCIEKFIPWGKQEEDPWSITSMDKFDEFRRAVRESRSSYLRD